MRIKLGNLRRLLREAPLADILPTSNWRSHDLDDEETDDSVVAADKKAVDRFSKTPLYRDKAVKAFRNFPFPVYIIPAWASSVTEEERSASYRGEEARHYLLQSCQLSPEKVDELMAELDSGAAVFVSVTTSLRPGFLPTPWMILHAIFDDSSGGGIIDPDLYSGVYDTCSEIEAWAESDVSSKDERDARLSKIFTFASARNKQLGAEDDIAAEAMTQAIATKGFVYNETGDRKCDKLLKRLSSQVKKVKSSFLKSVRGSVVFAKND